MWQGMEAQIRGKLKPQMQGNEALQVANLKTKLATPEPPGEDVTTLPTPTPSWQRPGKQRAEPRRARGRCQRQEP